MSEQYFTRPNVQPVITNIGTTPEQRQMSTSEFKAKFDEMPEAIQQYIKETLLAELDAFKEEFMTHQAENVSDNVHGLSSVLGNIVELTVINGWSGFQGQPLRYVRIGNVGVVFGEIVRSDSSSAGEVIATLPYSHAVSRFRIDGYAGYIGGNTISFEAAVPAGRRTIIAIAKII